ncbi:MAG: CsbD family protein [Terracidiphilus sp.]
MDKDRVKGSIDDTVGRAKRQVGEWTGNTGTQAEGAAQQVKGKAEKAWGNVKDAVRDAQTDADRERQRNVEAERNRESEHVGSAPPNTRNR